MSSQKIYKISQTNSLHPPPVCVSLNSQQRSRVGCNAVCDFNGRIIECSNLVHSVLVVKFSLVHSVLVVKFSLVHSVLVVKAYSTILLKTPNRVSTQTCSSAIDITFPVS